MVIQWQTVSELPLGRSHSNSNVNGTWAIQNAPLNIPRNTSRDVFQSKIQLNLGPEISQSMLIIFRIYYTVIGKSKGQHDQVQLKPRVQMVKWGVWCYVILVSTYQYLSMQYTILAKDIVKSCNITKNVITFWVAPQKLKHLQIINTFSSFEVYIMQYFILPTFIWNWT